MEFHSQRQMIADEVHARPFQQLSAPLKVMHFAVMITEHEPGSIREAISELFQICGAGEITADQSFSFQSAGELALRWEAHTEFYTLTIYYEGAEQNWSQTIPGLPTRWSDMIPGEMITGVQLLVRTADGENHSRVPEGVFGDTQVIGSNVMRGAATVWTDFKAQGEFGLDRILVQDNHLHGYQCGRLLQRLCEIDTYRAVALLGLEPARKVMRQISSLDRELAEITTQLSQLEKGKESDTLDALMNLAARGEEISAETANRFSASDAYYAVVRMRISELEESRVEGLQTIEQFIDRRVDPAMRTWRAAAARLDRLSERVARASNLLRSNIELSTEQKIHGLLSSMNKRTRRQLTLQAKLETFSIIVVTYYLFDLVERTIRHMTSGKPEEIAINWLSYSLPAIVLLVWWYVRRVTKEFKSDD
ncbi:DUF3422 domain-containing protein [Amphritea balenae]|uniref:DUF3422 family protein n=1 Tax=Amphritea balenae TaxID=452629 RepID=A0A3P1SUS4_9GAMM|nr:DUF3422 domain-containing protein [Amphritea balenae]RRC99902.1 DUF3422 family protein [Amphritea balenae]GGK74935.1 hypothetical protein GCM10007941_26270 [Amphritea balenae]